VDLNSYAELAVRLVNTAGGGGEDGDRLVNLDGVRALVADREHLNTGVSRNDLDALRALRAEFRAFFVACAEGDGEDAAAQLNALLIQHPVHPQLSGHDGQSWHVHYTERIGRGQIRGRGGHGPGRPTYRPWPQPVRRLPGGGLPGCVHRPQYEQHPAVLFRSLHESGERLRLPRSQAR